MAEQKKERVAIVPGSFDPITLGHLDILRRAAALYDRVYLAVMINREKRYMFTLEERHRIASVAVRDIDRVEVISSDGMLWELARDLGVCAIVKGYRNEIDLQYEQSMAEYNRERYPQAETVLLPSDDQLLNISSTVVRERLQTNESLVDLLPSDVIDEIMSIFNKRK